jgi:hypothetical protein
MVVNDLILCLRLGGGRGVLTIGKLGAWRDQLECPVSARCSVRLGQLFKTTLAAYAAIPTLRRGLRSSPPNAPRAWS